MRNGQGAFRHHRRTLLAPKTTLCLALLATIPGNSGAFDVDYEIGLAAMRSDNISLSEDNEVSETVLAPRIRFDVAQEGSALKLEAHGEVERREYLDDTFPNEWRGNFAGQANWAMFPERVSLVLEDYLSYEPVDLRAGLSPGNVQRVNVFLGGPSFHARFNEVTRAQLDLRVANSYAELTEDFNGDRYGASARLQRELSSTQQASLNLVATEAEFDDPGQASDFSRQDAFIGYRREHAHGNVELELGRSRVHPKDRATVSSTLARADITWQATARSRFSALARYQLADATQDMIIRQGDLSESIVPELALSTVQVNPDVYRQRRLQADYRYTGDRLSIRLRPRHRRYRYLETTLDDRDDYSGYLELGYRARPNLTLSLQASAVDREFVTTQRKDQDRVYGLECDYRWTRHLSWQAGIYRNSRDSTEVDSSYRENAARFTVTWRR